MNENQSRLSTKEAAELAGVDPRTIQGKIKKGRLSATRDEGGNYIIDRAEFYRVYPDAQHVRSQPKEDDDLSRKMLENHLQHVMEMVKEKSRQIEFLQKQLEISTSEKGLLLETLNSNQKLLEHKSVPKRKRIFWVL